MSCVEKTELQREEFQLTFLYVSQKYLKVNNCIYVIIRRYIINIHEKRKFI